MLLFGGMESDERSVRRYTKGKGVGMGEERRDEGGIHRERDRKERGGVKGWGRHGGENVIGHKTKKKNIFELKHMRESGRHWCGGRLLTS